MGTAQMRKKTLLTWTTNAPSGGIWGLWFSIATAGADTSMEGLQSLGTTLMQPLLLQLPKAHKGHKQGHTFLSLLLLLLSSSTAQNAGQPKHAAGSQGAYPVSSL
jgi:hypothetical protein